MCFEGLNLLSEVSNRTLGGSSSHSRISLGHDGTSSKVITRGTCSLTNICQSGVKTTGWSDIRLGGPKMLGRKRVIERETRE